MQDFRGEKQENKSLFESEKRLKDLAIKTNKSITVEYFENGERTKTLIYKPSGEVETMSKLSPQQNPLSAELLELFKNIDNFKEYENFIQLAIQSIQDDEALKQLEFVINGIKMARRIK